jgi:hypothetical protein
MVHVVIVPHAEHVAARLGDADVAQRAERELVRGLDHADVVAAQRGDELDRRRARLGVAAVHHDDELARRMRLAAVVATLRLKAAAAASPAASPSGS